MTKPQQALIYCRVSDTKQTIEGSGLQSQQHRCEQHALEKGYVVEKVFHDDVTGGGDFMKRRGMVALLSYLKRHQKTDYVVIFDDLKRLARDTLAHWQLRYAMMDVGAMVECLNFKFEDTPEGEFIETLFAAQGQLERKQIGRQTKQKTIVRLEAGYHAFIAPVGFKYDKSKTQGKVLVKDEPVASIIAEMMEGFASGRFQTKSECKYFLENSPVFPKTKSGKIGNSQVDKILSNPLYAGYIEYKPWHITLRKGQHEGMVSYATFLKIQERLKGRANAPARKDLNKDFVMRGAVTCGCGNHLTACWSKSRNGKHHAYYVCQNRKCEYKGRSIRRDVLEGEFETLLKSLTPAKSVMAIADKMFRMLWDYRSTEQAKRQSLITQEIATIERKLDSLLDKIVDAESDIVIKAYEKKIKALKDEKRVLEEKAAQTKQPVRPFDEMYQTALNYLANPHKIWVCGGFEMRRNLLKLTFENRLVWDRKGMYRTPHLSLPFKVLGEVFTSKKLMVPRRGIEPRTRGFSVPCSTN